MRVKSFIVICSALFAASAFAQQNQSVIGKVTELAGVVTVTDGVRGGTATLGSPVVDGSRYVTSSNGRVTLRLDNGCDIKLEPNQAVTVRERPCAALIAGIQSVGVAAVLATAGTGGSAAAGALGVVAIGAGGLLLEDQFLDNRPISSN